MPWPDDPGPETGSALNSDPNADLEPRDERAQFVLYPSALTEAVTRAVARALAEDLGDLGDVTAMATVPADAQGGAVIVARAPGVIAGTACAVAAFAQVDERVRVDLVAADGARVAAGDVIARISGPLRSVLTGERTALNFLGHLSGIATTTRRYADLVEGTDCVVRDTRKTTPGLRLLDKAAVVAGGGVSHRLGLHDALLVKDNHVLAAGSAGAAATAAVARSQGRPVQVEVTSLGEIDEVLAAGVDDLLLDNFSVEQVVEAVGFVAGRAHLEASGGITLDTLRAYAETGVDSVAVGGLTHSAPWLDVALDVDAPAPPPVAAQHPEDPEDAAVVSLDEREPDATWRGEIEREAQLFAGRPVPARRPVANPFTAEG